MKSKRDRVGGNPPENQCPRALEHISGVVKKTLYPTKLAEGKMINM